MGRTYGKGQPTMFKKNIIKEGLKSLRGCLVSGTVGNPEPSPCRYRNNLDNNPGLSETSRTRRKRLNLVSARFNMINWLLEMISTITVIFIGDFKILIILYILLNSVCTPLVTLSVFIDRLLSLLMLINFRSTILALKKTEEKLRSISFHV